MGKLGETSELGAQLPFRAVVVQQLDDHALLHALARILVLREIGFPRGTTAEPPNHAVAADETRATPFAKTRAANLIDRCQRSDYTNSLLFIQFAYLVGRSVGRLVPSRLWRRSKASLAMPRISSSS